MLSHTAKKESAGIKAGTTTIFGRPGVPMKVVEQIGKSLRERIPVKRLDTPEEIAKAAVFLPSCNSSNVTGIELSVEGGLTHL
jgi:NAD(P)-dependent dehydrogenase (short-subunit alcohol dehydrogenase family)